MSASRSAWMAIGLISGNSTGASSGFWLVTAGVTCAESGALGGMTTGPAAGGGDSLRPPSVNVRNKAAKREAWRRWRNFDRDVINESVLRDRAGGVRE